MNFIGKRKARKLIESAFRDTPALASGASVILGYDREIITPAQATQRFGDQHDLPFITNNEKIVSGEDILQYITELQNLIRDRQAFQGDWCYVNDQGDVC